MASRVLPIGFAPLFCFVYAAFSTMPAVFAAEGRQIEEVVVTAERKESSVQDTSISITAFTSEMIDDFGIRNQTDLQNLVPATTIQPYDAAIRGVGRNFRNLGGDPGVSTYINSVYSEDLYTATIGSFWDIDRIEILRGPQGTLYGRNAVGGAMNFLYKKPTDELEYGAKTIIGSYGTQDTYGMISGPVIGDRLNARATVTTRRHDGWVEEQGSDGPDLDSGDERNASLSFAWFITDNLTMRSRSNIAEVDRTFGGADGGGLIVLAGENAVLPGIDNSRNYDVLTHRVRAVDPAQTNPLAHDFVDPSQDILTYTNPTTGAPILAQRNRPGVDDGSHVRNRNVGLNNDPDQCVFADRDNIDGDDLCALTNGLNVEIFDQQGHQVEFEWDISEAVTFKYIFGYNDLLYERITDDDSGHSLVNDRQFYVNHEAEYVSHELQLFFDVGDNLTFTSGVFFYDAVIDQRYDFYTEVKPDQFYATDFALDTILADVLPGVVAGDPALTFLTGTAMPLDINSAERAYIANGLTTGQVQVSAGPWLGDASLTSIPHGIETPATDQQGLNKTEREAFAVYTQGVLDIDELFTLTVGVRYAYDDLEGSESLAQYTESTAIADAVRLHLATINILRGAIDAVTLQPTGLVSPWLDAPPITFGLYRELARRDEKVTWRVNLDYNITDDSLIYANITTGYRAGGFNLAFFSQTPEYEPEELIAYEIGYKAQFFDRTVQLNASAYIYDYETIHTRTEEACPVVATKQSLSSACAVVNSTTSIQAVPGAEMIGLEAELLWLATDNLTIGGNFSYTGTEYTEDFFSVDGASPDTPGSIYNLENNADRVVNIKGNRLLQVPEKKASAWASYKYSLGDSGTVDLMASYSYIGDVYFSAYEAEFDRAPAYDRIDLRATWKSPSEAWSVTGFVNNVTDEIGIRQILRHTGVDGYRRTAQVTEPRVYGVELSYNFAR